MQEIDTTPQHTTTQQHEADVAAARVLTESSNSNREQIESTARAQGWRPKEEFEDGNLPDQWVDADEFVRRGELIDKIKALSKETRKQRETMALLMEHHHKVRESEFKRALQVLKEEKKEAFNAGDADKVIEIEEKQALVRDKFEEFKQEAQKTINDTQETHPAYDAFVERHRNWYQKNQDATMFADAYGVRYAQSHPNADYEDILAATEKEVRRAYPELFGAKPRTAAVDNGTSTVTGQRSAKKNDDSFLTPDERRVMERFIKSIPGFTKEQYLEDIRRLRG